MPTPPATAPTPRRRRKRGFVAMVLVFAIMLVAGDAMLYRWATRQLDQSLADWASARAADGWTVSYAPPGRSGWPFAAEITAADFAVVARYQDFPAGLNWTAERLSLRVTLLHPRTFVIAVGGTQHLRAAPTLDLPFSADRFQAVVKLRPGVPPHAADVEVAGLHAGDATQGFSLAHLALHAETKPLAQQGEPALSLNAALSDLTLPPHPWALGPRIASGTLDFAITGPVPRTATLPARATAWRDGGGTVELRRIAFDWGPMRLDGSATLALDEHLQPMGAATARIVGYVATLDALAAGHAIAPQAALAAKAVLGLMAHAPADGGQPEVDVPLTLQNGALAVGRIPLGRLPEISWPDTP